MITSKINDSHPMFISITDGFGITIIPIWVTMMIPWCLQNYYGNNIKQEQNKIISFIYLRFFYRRSCPPLPTPCNWNTAYENPGSNYFTLYGALVGGPARDGSYQDKRSDFISNEVATDFNAGFQSAVAGLKYFDT